MTCQKIEKMILDALDENKNLDKIDKIQTHIISCKNCTQFLQHLRKVKKYIFQLPSPPPSNKCLIDTKQLCLSLLSNKNRLISSLERSLPIRKTTPKFVWVILSLLILVTVSWVIFVLSGDWKGTEYFDKKLFLVTITLQNMFMLLFAPLLLKYFKKQSLEKLL